MEGCAMGNFFRSGNGLVTFNKNIMKFYILDTRNNPVFLYDKILLENIIQIETYRFNYDSDGIFVLFESTKMCTVHFDEDLPIVNSLKYFEKDEYDIRHEDTKFFRLSRETGILKISRRFFSIFSVDWKGFPAQVYKFTDIDDKIKNVIDFVFLTNYTVPTFCIVFNSTPRSYINIKDYQAIICSYDSKLNTFYVIDEFEVSCYTKKVLFSNDILIFVSSNDLIFRTTGNCFHYPLNKMSPYSKENQEDIVLKDAQFYFKDEHLVIFNGNGYVYNLRIDLDGERIVNIDFKKAENLVRPNFINKYENLVFLGSNERSYLFEISYNTVDESKDGDEELKKQRMNVTELSKIINEEYEKIYGTSIESNEKKFIYLNKRYEFPGIGYINDLCVRDKGDYVAVSEGVENYILEFSDYFNFDIKKSGDCINFENFCIYDQKIILKNKDEIKSMRLNDFKYNESLKFNDSASTICLFTYKDILYQITKSKLIFYRNNLVSDTVNLETDLLDAKYFIYKEAAFLGLLDVNNILSVRDLSMTQLINIENVNSYCLYDEYCIASTSSDLIFFDLKNPLNQRKIHNISNFDVSYVFNKKRSKSLDNKIIEIECIKLREVYFVFLINSRGLLSVYKVFDDTIVKIVIDEFILFDVSKKSKWIYRVEDFVYLKSIRPKFAYVNSRHELFIYKSRYDIQDICVHCNEILFLTNNKFCRAAYPKFDCKTLLKKSDLFRNLSAAGELNIYDRYIFKKIPLLKIPKNIEISGNYILVVACEKVKFKESEYDDTYVGVFTYKYSIDLYTNSHKYISTFELDPDEYVFDIKELSLNDSIGFNGKSNFIVLCITKIEGEDKHSRGRLVILELIDIVTDETTKYKDKKLKLIASENIKGCIIKCDEIKGNVIVVLGIKTMVYKIDRSEGLIPIGIHDLHTLSTSLVTIKNYVLSSDIYRGLSFFYYQTRPVRLNLICTSNPIDYATHVDFIVRGSSLSVICMDVKGNMHTYTYSPKNILSCDGTKFVKRCETKFNLGRLVMKKAHSKMLNPVFISDSNYIIEIDSLEESLYSELCKLQSAYLSEADDTFGLNPENFNDQETHLKPPSIKKPIVREIITKFLNLPICVQEKYLKDGLEGLTNFH
jgi:cleavage and polyadenylation specificity factor subunit 1